MEETKKSVGEPMEMQMVSVEDLGPTGTGTRLRQFTYFLPEINRTVRVRIESSATPLFRNCTPKADPEAA
jgi:predicted RNA-binding protein with TRAM domain